MAAPRIKKILAAKKRSLRLEQIKTQKAKRALIGTTVSWTSTQGKDPEMYPTGFEKAKLILGGHAQAGLRVGEILESHKLHWHATAVIYCHDGKNFYDQPAEFDIEYATGNELGEMLEELFEKLKKLCNPFHIQEWGFRATITGVPNGN